jgi:uncharacterized damage-inducible protein DinB
MTERAQLLLMLDEAYDARSWHGTNLRGSIRGLTAEQAAWRPGQGRHNIWEIVVHAAYWKYAVRRRLTGERRGSFPLAGSNFWPRPAGTDRQPWGAALKGDVRLLGAMHARLRDVVEAFPEARLNRRTPGGPFTYAALIRGVAAHDLYHAGQIQLLKRMRKASAGRAPR